MKKMKVYQIVYKSNGSPVKYQDVFFNRTHAEQQLRLLWIVMRKPMKIKELVVGDPGELD